MPIRSRADIDAYTASLRNRAPVTSAVDLSGRSVAPWSWDDVARDEDRRLTENLASRSSHNRLVNIGRIASIAPLGAMFAPGGLAPFGGGAGTAASGAGWTMPGVTAPMFGAAASSAVPAAVGGGVTAGRAGTMATLGRIFSSPGMELGVNAGLNLLGTRSANKAAEQARQDQLTQYREALALQRQQLETEARNADLDREDARALNAAINELKKRELDAAEEERAFSRGLIEARETRLAPYRGVSESALRRLSSMWGLG